MTATAALLLPQIQKHALQMTLQYTHLIKLWLLNCGY